VERTVTSTKREGKKRSVLLVAGDMKEKEQWEKGEEAGSAAKAEGRRIILLSTKWDGKRREEELHELVNRHCNHGRKVRGRPPPGLIVTIQISPTGSEAWGPCLGKTLMEVGASNPRSTGARDVRGKPSEAAVGWVRKSDCQSNFRPDTPYRCHGRGELGYLRKKERKK